MTSLPLLIDQLHSGQAAELSALCHRIYPSYFTYLWFDDGAWYVDYAYNEANLRTELDDPNVRYFFARRSGEAVGYLKLNVASNLPGQSNEGSLDGFEIERIYFLREAAGQGLGTQLLEYAVAMARQLGKHYIWLHVMDSSLDSIAFYRKRGFEPVGETFLPFGQMKPGYRRMWQMQKLLT